MYNGEISVSRQAHEPLLGGENGDYGTPVDMKHVTESTDANGVSVSMHRGVSVDGVKTEARNYFESLDYELIESYGQGRVSASGFDRLQHVFFKWFFALLIALLTGTTAFLINMAVENISFLKFGVTLMFLQQQQHVWGFLTVALTNVVLVGSAAALCQFVSMEAAGSGIPDVKAYLNGVDTPRIFAPKTLLVKVLGSVGSVAGGLAVGKEGPLVHTGSCFANILGQGGSRKYHLTAKFLRYFKNDSDRRDLVTCGAAAGVAAAFRAPVGGVLFALEEVTSWWRSSLLWRVFFTTAVVAVWLETLLAACQGGSCGKFSSGGFIIFDSSKAENNFGLLELLPVVALGVLGGVLGSLFNHLNLLLNKFRQRSLPKSASVRIMEACFIALITAASRYGLPFLRPCLPCPSAPGLTGAHQNTTSAATSLLPLSSSWLAPAWALGTRGSVGATWLGDQPSCPSQLGNFRRFVCPPGHYNDLAGLLFTTNDDAVRNLFSTGTAGEFTPGSLLLFFGAFYVLSILTYGITVPSGLFVPSIICGATYGRVVGMVMTSLTGPGRVDQGTYSLLGAASFLGGSMRMTVSLSIILLELTGSLNMLPLIMLVLLISKTVGDVFNEAIYDTHIRLKGIPFLEARPEWFMKHLSARDAVLRQPVTLNAVETVRRIRDMLQLTSHNAYPLMEGPELSSSPGCYGLVLRRHLLVLLKIKKNFQPAKSVAAAAAASQRELEITFEEFGKPGSGNGLQLEDIQLSDEELDMCIDLRPFANRSYYVVNESMSLSKVYALFRQLGLRHLVVAPSPASLVGIITRKDLLPESLGERRVVRSIPDFSVFHQLHLPQVHTARIGA